MGTTRVSGSVPMASRPVPFSQVTLFHREVDADALSTRLVRCSVGMTFDSEGVASGLSHQPQFGGKDLVSSSVSSPQRSIFGVECRHLPSPDQRHSVFTPLAENRRSGPSHLLPRFHCFTAVAGHRLFSPTLGRSFSEKHISTSARPPARKQRTREVTAHSAATTTSTRVQPGVPGCIRWGVNSPPTGQHNVCGSLRPRARAPRGEHGRTRVQSGYRGPNPLFTSQDKEPNHDNKATKQRTPPNKPRGN
jgi:hypothetical protein